MHIRTFRAPNLQSALREIRDQMGTEAAVLHTRQVRCGWLGLARRKEVEVTAGLRETDSRGALSETLSDGEPRPFKGTDSPIARHLIQRGLDPDSVAQLLRLAQRFSPMPLPETVEQAWPMVMQAAGSLLRIGSPIRCRRNLRRIVALVGPTGVGKTTTIAKLAAGFRTQTGLRVGLVTIDTFRTGAVEQLRQYSRAMELPLEIAKDGEELGSALDRLKDSDLVLIDTAGKSPRDQPHLQQLVKLFQAVPPDEVHLVLSAASSPQAAERVLRGFAPVEPTGLILSKLDEVDATAHLLPVLTGGAPPLTYLAHGQNVPDDIQRAEKDLVLEYCF